MCEHNLNQWSSRIQRQCGSIIGRFIINVLHRRPRSGANRWARRWSSYLIIIVVYIVISIMIVIIIIIILIIIVMMNWALFGCPQVCETIPMTSCTKVFTSWSSLIDNNDYRWSSYLQINLWLHLKVPKENCQNIMNTVCTPTTRSNIFLVVDFLREVFKKNPLRAFTELWWSMTIGHAHHHHYYHNHHHLHQECVWAKLSNRVQHGSDDDLFKSSKKTGD